jgi:hypothetical protein
MVDSIQASVSIPIPKYQTGEGTHDPLPTTSPAEIDRSDNARHDQTQQTKKDDFEHYLNQRSITNLAETTKASRSTRSRTSRSGASTTIRWIRRSFRRRQRRSGRPSQRIPYWPRSIRVMFSSCVE